MNTGAHPVSLGSVLRWWRSALISLWCLGLAGCGHQASQCRLADLLPTAWVEEDSRGTVQDVANSVRLLEGFVPSGDGGWEIPGGAAFLAVRAVSRGDRVATLDMDVPHCGGRLSVRDCCSTLAESVLAGGRAQVPVFIEGEGLVRGWNGVWVSFSPARPAAGLHATVRQVSLRGVNEPLATVDRDSVSNVLAMGPGTAVSVYLEPEGSIGVRGWLEGTGKGRLLMAQDGIPPRVIWEREVRHGPVGCRLRVRPSRPGPVELRFEADPGGGRLTWRGFWLRGVKRLQAGSRAPRREPERWVSCKPTRSVILYVVDAVRRDHLQVYGYGLPTTPHLAADQTWYVFEDCQSLSSWTKASVASLVTGLSPPEHGTVDEDDVLPPHVPLVWDRFREAGFATALFSTNSHVASTYGFDRGLDHCELFCEDPQRPTVHLPADSLHLMVLRWLDGRNHGAPFFVYIHATDPHLPYTPPVEMLSLFASPHATMTSVSVHFINRLLSPGAFDPAQVAAIRACYDAEIAAWERAFSAFLDSLEARGLLDHTAVVLTSDHGEEFGEHGGFAHGFTLYAEQLRVPLMVRAPERRGGRCPLPLDHRDVADLLVWVASGMDIRSWSPPPRVHREAHLCLRGMAVARLQGPSGTTIWNVRPVSVSGRRLAEVEFYTDSHERTDLVGSHRVTAHASRAVLARWLLDLPPLYGGLHIDQATIERLRLLGYVPDQ